MLDLVEEPFKGSEIGASCNRPIALSAIADLPILHNHVGLAWQTGNHLNRLGISADDPNSDSARQLSCGAQQAQFQYSSFSFLAQAIVQRRKNQ